MRCLKSGEGGGVEDQRRRFQRLLPRHRIIVLMVAREVGRRWYYLILLAVFEHCNHTARLGRCPFRPHTHDEIGRHYERRHPEEGQDSVWEKPDPGCHSKGKSKLAIWSADRRYLRTTQSYNTHVYPKIYCKPTASPSGQDRSRRAL